jgi:hypothetical protein
MNKKFNGVIVETSGVRTIGGGGTNSNNVSGALANLGGYPASNPSGFITGYDTGLFYASSNPSGYITGISDLVYTTGDQVISGLKTFSQGISIEGDSSISALFVSGQRIGINNENPQASLDISGSTMFSERPTVNGTGVLLSGDIDTSNFYTNDNLSGFITGISDLVYTTGDQTISGRKLFSDGLDAGLQVGVSTLYIGSGVVGVNNEDPQAAFHVSGSALFANDVAILGNFSVSGTTFINEVIDVTTTGIISGVTGVFQHIEADNIVYSQTNACVVAQPGDDLIAKYAEAVALTPNGSAKSAINRASLVIFPGTYTLSETLDIDTAYVDVIGLGSTDKSPLVLISNYGIDVSASVVKIVGIGVLGGGAGFNVSVGSTSQIFENCVSGGDSKFGGNGNYKGCVSTGQGGFNGNGVYNNCYGEWVAFNGAGTYVDCLTQESSFNGNGASYVNCKANMNSFNGGGLSYINCTAQFASFNGNAASYKDCTAGNQSFGYAPDSAVTINGTFENCTAGNQSFGNSTDVVYITGATFKNCHGGTQCFGYSQSADTTIDVNSIFESCTAGDNSFGGSFSTNSHFGIADGVFNNCVGGSNSFGNKQASGTFTNCIAGNNSFGGGFFGNAGGTFTGCTGGDVSFGGNIYGAATGTFTNCTGGTASFGCENVSTGTFTNCTGGAASFGGYLGVTGKVFYCRLTSGTYPTPIGAGVIRLSLDGNNDVVNAQAI